MNTNPPTGPFAPGDDPDDGPENGFDWQDEADAGWESYVGVSRDDPTWEMMEEIAADAMYERSERD